MNKPYSNKALPAGTVLREWRLEEVLGVGGFGIVYKGRGIYFDELVAIKEYFPSSISERQDGDTVVPIDSDAEEVHALGLKKFVEEAKLLWNLSTPTRHPNIVSVRSLFEVHGTAYMVMDFEDGVSLSKLLKQGRRFNEASLTALIHPIAEGLERAHRVGVLHRDIKPANILINEDGRPVLIDFGSARFESGDATSTTVTFHTPPYAAIEQYVKTYEQGPWTDVYALGVVLYECVTGEKPAEVLERMHGGANAPLIDGNWPGFGRPFLAAIDAAMTIRPDDRPQSIRAWLDLFGRADDELLVPPADPDSEREDATRISKFEALPEKIVPVAPPPPGFSPAAEIETDVPTNTKEVRFKRVGEDTNTSQKTGEKAQPAADAVPESGERGSSDRTGDARLKPPPAANPGKPVPQAGKAKQAAKGGKPSSRTPLIAGGAVAAVLLVAGGWYLFGSRLVGPSTDSELTGLSGEASGLTAGEAVPVEVGNFQDLIKAVQSLAADARNARMPSGAVKDLEGASTQLAAMGETMQGLSGGASKAREDEMNALAKAASARFANALAIDAGGRAQRLAREVPWSDTRRANAAQAESAQRQGIAARLRNALAAVRDGSARAGDAADAGQAIGWARQAMQASASFTTAYFQAYRAGTAAENVAAAGPQETVVELAAPQPVIIPEKEVVSEAVSGGVTPAKLRQYKDMESSARDVANKVMRLNRGGKSGLSDDAKRTLNQNATSAQTYLKYLDTLTNSLRAAKSDREVDQAIVKANQTKTYLNTLLAGSQAAAQ